MGSPRVGGMEMVVVGLGLGLGLGFVFVFVFPGIWALGGKPDDDDGGLGG